MANADDMSKRIENLSKLKALFIPNLKDEYEILLAIQPTTPPTARILIYMFVIISGSFKCFISWVFYYGMNGVLIKYMDIDAIDRLEHSAFRLLTFLKDFF